jgi:hypothetical protein
MSRTQAKITRHVKKQKNVIHTQKKKQSLETYPELNQTWKSISKNLSVTVLKGAKKNILIKKNKSKKYSREIETILEELSGNPVVKKFKVS